MARRITRRRIAEINVVPYIDVMLVLLVIFMITAPLLNQGVEIELPPAEARPLPPAEQEPLILSVDREGAYYLNIADDPAEPLAPEALFVRAKAVMLRSPDIAVLVRADRGVAYGDVVAAMALLQKAGARKVGLSTRVPEAAP